MPTHDRILGALSALVNRIMSRVDYLALYPCTVVVATTAKADVTPDDPRIPDMIGVPIRKGVPGVDVLVAPGARVLLGFENGNPMRPFVSVWESGTAVSLTITATSIAFAGNVTLAGVGNLSLETIAGDVAIGTTAGNIDINTTLGTVSLGDGGALVARVGDTVAVDPGTHNGTITASSQTKVYA